MNKSHCLICMFLINIYIYICVWVIIRINVSNSLPNLVHRFQ